MDLTMLLATVTEETGRAAELLNVGEVKKDFWDLISTLDWRFALLMISVGVVYMLYGWRIFRVLVVISFGFIGLFLGILAGEKLSTSPNAVIWGGLAGMILFAIVSIPLMKWCVSVLGALAGGIVTGGLWIALGLSQVYLPAGFIVGFIAGGLISFILLKVSVMLFTSLGGSLILVSGMLALLHQYETQVTTPPTGHIHNLVTLHDWFLPLVLILPTVIGMIIQNKFIKQSPNWEI
ncbi:MAG: hypothetical protein L0Y36_02055 [Planctomycetales bacterium]|nr:hypothetical protein [Planctomycetales bacterium]